MSYSLVEAATACGVNRSTVLRTIRAGKISAGKDEQGEWRIEAVELHRVYPPVQTHEAHSEQAHQNALIAELRNALADMRQDRDEWREQAQRLALLARKAEPVQPKPAPIEQPSRFRRAWRWMRATGCLAGGGLLLALSTVPAGAQQQQPQQPPPGCFTVEMSHSTQGNPQGSILLDRCTGKTWLLLCIRNDTAGCAFRWAPIPDATEPAGGP
jgi:hypothetical protein